MRPSLKRLSLSALAATILLAGCGGAPEDGGTGQQPRSEAARAGQVTAQNYPDCNPDFYCSVSSPYVPCTDGIIMFAWATPDGGYCIDRDVCARHGGPLVCPY